MPAFAGRHHQKIGDWGWSIQKPETSD